MKLTKLKEIQAELKRFETKLNDAIYVANNDMSGFWDGDKWETEADKPGELRECYNCKQSGALKRAALDMKQILSNL